MLKKVVLVAFVSALSVVSYGWNDTDDKLTGIIGYEVMQLRFREEAMFLLKRSPFYERDFFGQIPRGVKRPSDDVKVNLTGKYKDEMKKVATIRVTTADVRPGYRGEKFFSKTQISRH